MEHLKKLLIVFLSLFLITGCRRHKPDPVATPEPTIDIILVTEEPVPTESPEVITETPEALIDEDGIYDTKDEVALYLYTYHHLPDNYMTKKEARKHGWENGALNRTIPGMCIGGDVYGNYEENLPAIKGKYYECDIDTIERKSRGAKRIVWSEYFDIYYTEDHYETFELLYEGEE